MVCFSYKICMKSRFFAMIAIANDHTAQAMKAEIKQLLDSMGLEYKDFGSFESDASDYPIFAARAANAVASGECEKGILICGTGIGIGIAANKVKGIRCAMCSDPLTAALTRQHNDANMISMGARIIGPELAKEIVRTFLTTPFSGSERHQRRLDMVAAIERGEAIE